MTGRIVIVRGGQYLARHLVFLVLLLWCSHLVHGFVLQTTTSANIHKLQYPWGKSDEDRFLAFTRIPNKHSLTSLSNSNSNIDNDEAFFVIETSHTGPGNGPVHTLRFRNVPGQKRRQSDTHDTDDDTDVDKNRIVQLPDIVIETGKIGRQAAGAVTLTCGESVLYATAARDDKPKADLNFVPLSVEHQERFSSAGLTSGSYNKRDGRAAEHEILTCRLIDRPLRPLIAHGWRHETQILSWVLSYDGIRSCDPLAILASATALYLSDVPLSKPVAAVQVGIRSLKNKTTAIVSDGGDDESESDNVNSDDDQQQQQQESDSDDSIDEYEFILNPTNQEMDDSPLNLIVAGTADGILMIEGAADFLSEQVMLEALEFGHKAIRVYCQGVEAFAKVVHGVVEGDKSSNHKNYATIQTPPKGLQERVDELYTAKIDDMYAMGGNKAAQGQIMSNLQKGVVEELQQEFPDDSPSFIQDAFKDLLCRRMFVRAKETGLRSDGRELDEIRRLDMTVGLLPRVHGSALFTRGETQVIATTTLGDASMRQKIDKIDGLEEKRFYLQYSFPPSSVGETGRVGAPGRREVGHGNLAERALIPVVPKPADFPYVIRVESLVTEAHGSSSMASVCGASLALMDAGVPIKKPVAGIAMGMLLGDKDGISDENAVILSDISGTEDALGTMDFKVAGDRHGITTFQLDIKCEGLTLETMARALEQARQGRLHLLDEMDKVISAPRQELPPTVPKMLSFSIPYESIGKVIGPGGKQIRSIIEDHELENMDVGDDGKIQVSSFKQQRLEEAKLFVEKLISKGGGGRGDGPGGDRKERPKYEGPPPEQGKLYTGKIVGIHNFGVFVEILPGAEDGSTPGLEGLVHVSELARERVRNCEGFMRSMGVEEMTVKYMGMDKGKHRLSRKAALEQLYGFGDSKNGSSNNGSTDPTSRAPPSSPAFMSPEEVDVIAEAIKEI
jgi:polyribonucleotide nucleotidyltransferase